MATAFDTFPTYQRVALEGQIRDESMADIRTSVADVSIPFGRAMYAGNTGTSQMGAVLPAAGGGLFLGISMRLSIATALTIDPLATGNFAGAGGYVAGRTVSRVAYGFIWVRTIGGATRGQQVYAVPATGELTNVVTGNILLPGCYFDSPAAAGELAIMCVKGERAIAA
jgi:hypothetical protein